MSKLVSIVLCVLALCMALCACGNDNSAADMASEAISDVATHAEEIISGDDGVVTDGDGQIGNETNSATQNNMDESQNSTTSETTNNENDNGMM